MILPTETFNLSFNEPNNDFEPSSNLSLNLIFSFLVFPYWVVGAFVYSLRLSNVR